MHTTCKEITMNVKTFMLGDFFSQDVAQLNLFDDNAPRRNSAQLMEVLDRLNTRNGRVRYFCEAGDSATLADEARNAISSL